MVGVRRSAHPGESLLSDSIAHESPSMSLWALADLLPTMSKDTCEPLAVYLSFLLALSNA